MNTRYVTTSTIRLTTKSNSNNPSSRSGTDAYAGFACRIEATSIAGGFSLVREIKFDYLFANNCKLFFRYTCHASPEAFTAYRTQLRQDDT